ncbi:Flp pilus assembly complex ATPase component TadA [Candidatus Parcubacteria bacterium]|nr:Flp pilus assembly complex ATPase component TadA [Candidatus Parcubacteria bacterium]
MNEGALRNFLLDSGLISRSDLDDALRQAQGRQLPQVLVELGLLSEDEMRRATSSAFGVPFVVLTVEEIDPEALLHIPEPLARNRNMVGYQMRDDTLHVALLSLDDLPALDFLRARMKVAPRLTNRESLNRALLIYQRQLKKKFGEAIARDVHAIIEPAPGASEELLRYAAERLPVVYATDALMRHAFSQKATHVHLEERDEGLLVRYRIAGAMYDAMLLPRHASLPIMLRLKLLANMRLETSGHQEGRFKIQTEDETYTMRATAVPTARGEKIVLRIVPTDARGFTLESLGFHGEALEKVHAILLRRKGLVLVTGPEGAGKSTTLYTLLDIVHSPHLSVATVEESLEMKLAYASQTVADSSIGLTTAAALRAALRLDPDVVMVGNVSNKETAEMVAGAAQRGILVLVGTEKPDLLTAEADMLIEVRRVRRLCTHSSTMQKLSRTESNIFEEVGADFTKVLAALKEEKIIGADAQWKEVQFAHPAACKECDQGYKGYIGLQEVVTRVGAGQNLIEDALCKAAVGQTSIEEIIGILEKKA